MLPRTLRGRAHYHPAAIYCFDRCVVLFDERQCQTLSCNSAIEIWTTPGTRIHIAYNPPVYVNIGRMEIVRDSDRDSGVKPDLRAKWSDRDSGVKPDLRAKWEEYLPENGRLLAATAGFTRFESENPVLAAIVSVAPSYGTKFSLLRSRPAFLFDLFLGWAFAGLRSAHRSAALHPRCLRAR